MRIMGLDYGAKTVGVAISDDMLITAQPVETIRRERPTKLRQTLARIETLMKEYDVEKVVIGLPKKLNNEEGERCEKTREFGEMVERRSGLELYIRMSVSQQFRLTVCFQNGGIRKEKRKQYIDKMAASLILQSYLGSLERK